ncbi:MAG: alanine--tRNA ligase, partial [Bacteroidetes bacterium]|nr:alanine--tRNA ligase [Bacteroidota bacterium]
NIPVIDTKKENNLTIHISPSIPSDPKAQVIAKVDDKKRKLTERNHTATHLLHFALREVLGKHVEQKGSLVGPDRLRFDFSHFQKVTDEEIAQVEKMVNELIATNISICEHRELPIAEAEKLGAIALFGEKYGDSVRVVGFGKSIELCGGTHVSSTATIGRVIVVSEGAIAAGIRRIEAITSETAEQYLKEKLQTLDEILALTKNPKEPAKAIQELIDQNTLMRKQIEDMLREKAGFLCESLEMQVERRGDINLLTAKISGSAQLAKDIAYAMKGRVGDLFFLIGHEEEGKAGLALWISETLVKSKNWNASAMIRDLAKHIQGGGGGQPFFASAGGKNPAGIDAALEAGRKIVK